MGYRIGIATSKPTVFAKQVLEHFKLSEYFDHIVGSNLNNTRINKDEIISECFNQFKDSEKESYVMIGDREHDIRGAKKLGVRTIGVLYGYGTKKELEEAGSDYIVSKNIELPELFRNS